MGVLFIPILLFSENLFLLLGQDENLAKSAQAYLRIAGWSIIPGLFIMALKSFFSALERPKVVLVSLVVGGLANIFLNYALIFGNFGCPELGLVGAAIATLLTTMLSMVILIYYCLFKIVVKLKLGEIVFQSFLNKLKASFFSLSDKIFEITTYPSCCKYWFHFWKSDN